MERRLTFPRRIENVAHPESQLPLLAPRPQI
jgi:hypothetical protein